jgi:hypothetical protein
MFDNFSNLLNCGSGEFRCSLGKGMHQRRNGVFSTVCLS